MEQRYRLTFLARHYYDLQGVRLVPVWVAGIFATFLPLPDGPKGVFGLIAGLAAIEIVWFWLARRYYRTHFGWLKPDPLRFLRTTPRGWPFWLWWAASAAVLLYCWFANSRLWVVFWLISLMAEQAVETENPAFRRMYYGVGAVIITLVGTLSRLEHWDSRGVVAITCAGMIAVAIADHMLLLRLFALPKQDIDA